MDKKTFLKELGQQVKRYRKLKKLTQSELAEAIGVTKSTICKIEIGRVFIKPENIINLVDLFDIKCKDLFDI